MRPHIRRLSPRTRRPGRVKVAERPDGQAELEEDERNEEEDDLRADAAHARSPTLSLAGSAFQTRYE